MTAVKTKNKSKTKPEPPQKACARDRILKAAIQVFGEEGIKGATTREIGRVAGVNECTLFRHFQSKDELLKAVVEHRVEEMTIIMAGMEIKSRSLHEDLLQYALRASKIMTQDEGLLRTFIGEANRQPEYACSMIRTAREPLVEKLMIYFKDKQDKGLMRKDIDLRITTDAFMGVIQMSVLNQPIRKNLYSTQAYLKTAIDIFVHGIALRPIKAPR